MSAPPAKCQIDYNYVLDKDTFEGVWNLAELLPSWIISAVLSIATIILPVILIHLGVWFRRKKDEKHSKEKKLTGSEEMDDSRHSDWDDEGIPYVTNMTDYLRTQAPAAYLEKFIEKQKKNGPPVIRIPGKTTVAVQTDTIKEFKKSKSKKKSRERSKEKTTSREKSREKMRTPFRSKDKINDARSLKLQTTMSSLHESATQAGSSVHKQSPAQKHADHTQLGSSVHKPSSAHKVADPTQRGSSIHKPSSAQKHADPTQRGSSVHKPFTSDPTQESDPHSNKSS